MLEFRSRAQLPSETHRVYGLELQNLLHKARPRVGIDEDYFLEELFAKFVEGLSDKGEQRAAYDAWKQDASLEDIFQAIDVSKKKLSLLSGRMPQRTSAMVINSDSDQSDDEWDGDENVGAVNFKGNSNKNSFSRSKDYSSNKDKYRTTRSSNYRSNTATKSVGEQGTSAPPSSRQNNAPAVPVSEPGWSHKGCYQ